jgi:hypothetical protein
MQFKTVAYALLIAGVAAVGATSPSLAAKKKVKADEPVTPWCYQVQKAVCATRGGTKMTYASACFAEKDGAKVVSEGGCGAKKMSMKKGGKKKKK